MERLPDGRLWPQTVWKAKLIGQRKIKQIPSLVLQLPGAWSCSHLIANNRDARRHLPTLPANGTIHRHGRWPFTGHMLSYTAGWGVVDEKRAAWGAQREFIVHEPSSFLFQHTTSYFSIVRYHSVQFYGSIIINKSVCLRYTVEQYITQCAL